MRVVVKVLGYGGAGHEAAVARLVGHDDERVAREALRALARIGTDAAAGLIADQIREGSAERRAAAEEALWHFPPAQATAQARVLLRSRDFVRRHPIATKRAVRALLKSADLCALEPERSAQVLVDRRYVDRPDYARSLMRDRLPPAARRAALQR